MRLAQRLMAAVGVLVLGASLAACSTRPPSDEVWLFYANGSVDTKEFKKCIDPNTKGPWQANNDTFALPTTLRTWNIQREGGDTNVWTVVGSKPGADGQAGPQIGIWSTTEFYLNTNCDGGKDSPVVKFWQATGSRKDWKLSEGDATFNSDNWRKVLLNTLAPVQEKAMQRVARNWTADEMDTNSRALTKVEAANPATDKEVWKRMEEAMQKEFTEQLRLKVGGDYFCGIGFDRTTGACPEVRVSITSADYTDPAVQTKRNEVRASVEDAKKRLIEAQAKVDESNKLGQATSNPNYMRLKELENQLQIAQACAAAPACTLIVPNGNGVNVNTK